MVYLSKLIQQDNREHRVRKGKESGRLEVKIKLRKLLTYL